MLKSPALRKPIHQQFNDTATLLAGLLEAEGLIKQARPGIFHSASFSGGDLSVQGVDAGEELTRLGEDPGNGFIASLAAGDEFDARLDFNEDFALYGHVKGTDHQEVTTLVTAISDRLAAAASARP